MAAILENKILIATVLSWVIAQLIKVSINTINEKRFDINWFFQTGGMPSSHSAGATALATSCGLEAGFDSIVFAIAAVFALVTMFDAQGVRHSAGRQATLLNKILIKMSWDGDIADDPLRELIGHTRIQVLAGAALGILMGCLFHYGG